ncbi:amino acid adenylation domain-containing protein [Micromonospora sp. NPDC005222]|uniref:amino acid adenylation domain-containing protein n=1 Tax=Micromonospora sp. NPDC005222 TaxID=3157025 RepID=UPI0033AE6282
MTTNELDRVPVGPGGVDRRKWAQVAAEVLGCATETIEERADTASFIDLGGTSLRAADFAARVERRLGVAPPLRALRAAVPLTEAMAQATEYRPVSAGDESTAVDRPLLTGQAGMLLAEDMIEGRPVRVIYTAESAVPLNPERLRSTLAALTRNHEALRTIFTSGATARAEREALASSHGGYVAGSPGDDFSRRVLSSWEPRLIEQRLVPPAGGDVVAIVHSQLSAAPGLLRPFEEPPILFVHTRVEGGPDLLSVLFHHALMDGWALGRFWHVFAHAYTTGVAEPGPSPDLIAAWHREISENGRLVELTRLAVEDLAGLPETVPLPVDRKRPEVPDVMGVHLPFGLSAELRNRVEATAQQLGVPHTVVVCSAWAMAVGRRAGLRDLAIGVAMSGREAIQLHDVLGLCVRIVPVRFQIDGARTVAEQLRAWAASWSAATGRSELPFEEIIRALGKEEVRDRTPVIQAVFEAHDELVGDRLRAGDLDLRLHEGYGGSSMMETTLFLTNWGERPSLQLEYQPSVFRPDEAIALIEGFTAALEELVTDLDAPVSSVRAVSAEQRRWLDALSDGPATDCEADLWHLFEETAERFPDEVAVDDLTYDELLAAVRTQAAALAQIRPGDRVVLAVPRGVAEVVAVLAVLHRGAAYVAVDQAAPRDWLAQILRQVSPVAVIGAPEVAELAGRPSIEPWTPAMPLEPGPEPAPADPGRFAYIAFTSGSSGRPKGVPVPHRAVVRLIRDADYAQKGPGERFLRAAPLAFDASTFEIFGSLLSGAGLQILPDGPVAPTELARFLIEREVTVAFLTTGLFRLMADHRPEAFARMRQVITGGEVTPPQQVRRVLERHEGLRISLAYGPTECTTFTTIHHFDSPAEVSDPLPIGRPLAGTRLIVLDDEGHPVPPGAVGELCVGGIALAEGYLDQPEETARAFGAKAPDTGERLYRTGDLVRWDGRGRLMFVGRLDQQLKVRGFRVEPEAVARRLREHPGVRDAVVVGEGKVADQRLIAGVIPEGPAPSPAELRAWVGQTLPAWAVPELWAFIEAFPLTRNAKVDLRALAAQAVTMGSGR